MKKSKPDQLSTVAALARSLGHAVPTVRGWTRRPDWPFSKAGPWNVADVPAIDSWAVQTLRSFTAPKADDHADVDFWQTHKPHDAVPWSDVLENWGIVAKPIAELPVWAFAEVERAILDDTIELEPEELKAMVLTSIDGRCRLVAALDRLGSHLVGRSESEIDCRIRAILLNELKGRAGAIDRAISSTGDPL